MGSDLCRDTLFMRKITVFDFEGTIIGKDSFVEFIKFSKGTIRCYLGLFGFLPILVLMKTGLYPSWKAKGKVFSFFFKGMEYGSLRG